MVAVEKREISCPHRDSNIGPSNVEKFIFNFLSYIQNSIFHAKKQLPAPFYQCKNWEANLDNP